MSALVLRGDARCLPLADDSVDLIVTSPPYFALRSYTDGGEHYDGQVGAEATPQEFIDALLACTVEWMRVLKPSGSLWVNLGDKYAGSANEKPHTGSAGIAQANQTRNVAAGRPAPLTSVRPKSLIGVPWRYALGCIDQLGLILRAEVIWSKPNGLPESVTDRVRRSHEQWFHFTKEPRYYSAVDEIREEHLFPNQSRTNVGRGAIPVPNNTAMIRDDHPVIGNNPLGKLPGSVWTVPTQPLQVPASLGVDHFAAFPMEFPRRIIRGWSPSGICTACGEGRRPVTQVEREAGWVRGTVGSGGQRHAGERVGQVVTNRALHTVTGEACDCPTPDAPTRPAIILDPFGGTGTTALVADTLGRIGISVDLSHDYSRLARWRTTDPQQRATAMQVKKPAPELDGQGDLFGDVA